ncbi:MAG: hypothetical protein K9J27_11080 [Bacteroidales bacterium]|nr:hypothetical protein [Bacteroidales bacterium]MCF8334406.1 hypothetical protein [Bacteroidales bacterium]
MQAENADLNKMVNPTTGEKVVPANAKGMQEATVDATFFVDEEDWVMVKSIFDIHDIQMKNKKRNAKAVMINDDFRSVQGVIIPYHTEFTMEMDMTAEEKKKAKEARKSMKEMKEKMEDMPPEKRKMMIFSNFPLGNLKVKVAEYPFMHLLSNLFLYLLI